MGKLEGRVAIVTGGSQGIGKAIARGLAIEGARIVLAARSVDKLNHTARELASEGSTVAPIPTDVTDESQVSALFQRTQELFDRLDILVNNAGAFDGGPLDEMSTESWDKVIATNLRGPFLCTRAAMRIMKAQRSGRILNIGSISAQRPRANGAAYAASKFGLWGLTNATALEGREFGIAVGCLHPGNVPFDNPSAPDPHADEPMMAAKDLAEVAVLMLSQPAHINMLEAIVLPVRQLYLGRG